MGPQGPSGTDGIDGADGINCWDLNGNGIGDPAEDTNGDLTVDVNDCTGLQGPQGDLGPTGPQGPQGPLGPGSLAAFDTNSGSTTIGSTCTPYAGAIVTITVPSNGYVGVSAQVQLRIDHVTGIRDVWVISVGAGPADCNSGVFGWTDALEDDYATDSSVERTAYAQRWYAISPGTYDFYVTGYMMQGGSADDEFWYSNMIAVFYPS